jgi:hypothetical protein
LSNDGLKGKLVEEYIQSLAKGSAEMERSRDRKKEKKCTSEDIKLMLENEIRESFRHYMLEQDKWNGQPPPPKEKFYDYLLWRMLCRKLTERIKIDELKEMLQKKAEHKGVIPKKP